VQRVWLGRGRRWEGGRRGGFGGWILSGKRGVRGVLLGRRDLRKVSGEKVVSELSHVDEGRRATYGYVGVPLC